MEMDVKQPQDVIPVQKFTVNFYDETENPSTPGFC